MAAENPTAILIENSDSAGFRKANSASSFKHPYPRLSTTPDVAGWLSIVNMAAYRWED